MTTRDYALDKECANKDKYKAILMEAMYVITSLLTSCSDEHVFRQYIHDKAIIELLMHSISVSKGLNMSHNLIFRCLKSLEHALNFDMFESHS